MKQLTFIFLLLSFSIQLKAENIRLIKSDTNKSTHIAYRQSYKSLPSIYPLSILRRRVGPDIILGLNAGLNLSKVRGENVSTKLALNSFEGIFLRLQFNETKAYQLNVNYSVEGYRNKSIYTTNDGQTHTDDFKMHFKYVKLPFTVRFSFGERFIFNINTGVYISFLLSARQQGKITIEQEGFETITGNVDEGAMESFSKFDAGFVLGTGVEYPLTDKRKGINYKVFANLGLNYGLVNISSLQNSSLKNNTFYSGLGLFMIFD